MRHAIIVTLATFVCFGLVGCGHSNTEQPDIGNPAGNNRGSGPRHSPSAAMGDMFLFISFDRNTDYKITFEEVNAGIDKVFEKADADDNGSISQAEYGGWAALALGDAYAEPYFLHLDKDQNAILSKAEFTNSVYARARRYDKDQNNVLTYAELRPVWGPVDTSQPKSKRKTRSQGESRRGSGKGRGGRM
jgi:hypothetical protein